MNFEKSYLDVPSGDEDFDSDFFEELFGNDDEEPPDFLVKAAQPQPGERPPPLAPSHYHNMNQGLDDPLGAANLEAPPARPHRGPAAKPQPEKNPNEVLDLIWVSFFNRTYDVAEQSVLHNLIPTDDILDEEAFLYLGLAGATILDALVRSLRSEGVELAVGKVITEKNCPPKHLKMFHALNGLKQKLAAAHLSDEENVILRKIVLFAQSADKPEPKQRQSSPQNDKRLVMINRIAAGIQSVATEVTQLPFYKEQFDNILELLQVTLESSQSTHNQYEKDFDAGDENKENDWQNLKESTQQPSTPKHPPASSATDYEVDDIWKSFFNRTFEIVEHALKVKLISLDEIEDREAFLYFGLVGTTVLDSVFRSLQYKSGISLSAGAVITETNCPKKHIKMFEAFQKVKTALIQASLSPQEQKVLRMVVLYASSEDHEIEQLPDEHRQVVVNRIAAAVQSISTGITQMPFYRQQFDEILTLVSAMFS